jgi:hypothetical protein
MVREELRVHRDLVEFQLQVAARWMTAARQLPAQAERLSQFEFIAYFAALNALYWLWGVVSNAQSFTEDERRIVEGALVGLPDDLRRRVVDRLIGPVGEHRLMSSLVGSLPADVAGKILEDADVKRSIQYLLARGPVQRMDRREADGVTGSIKEARQLQLRLRNAPEPFDRLLALSQILYIVRCNLVHGSKVLAGLDIELLQHSVPPLRMITEASVAMIRKVRPWQ